jgi:hypothetical protein
LVRHPEALAPLGASLEGRAAEAAPQACLFVRLGRSSFEGRAKARPPHDDGIWIDMTGTCSNFANIDAQSAVRPSPGREAGHENGLTVNDRVRKLSQDFYFLK